MSSRNEMASRRFLRFAVGALALATTVAVWSVVAPYSVAVEAEPLAPESTIDAPASFAGLIEAVKPAVVNISVKGRTVRTVEGMSPWQPFGPQAPSGPEALPPGAPFEDFLRRFFERRGGPVTPDVHPFEGMGTGFIVDPDGLVVTNYHVVDRAEAISVTLDDGSRYEATLRGHDEKTDLALLEIDASELPFVAFGDSDAAQVGDWVVAIGNPFGLGGSATSGIISARGRDIQAGPFDDFLQIDAPINRGNSGGPLFDLEGRVIGINTMIYSPNGGNIGIGFAIPAAVAQPVIEDLRDIGHVERGWLGVQVQDIDEHIAAGLGLDSSDGALVAEVVQDGPAAAAGVRTGDVIVGFDGAAVDDINDLARMVAGADPAAEVEVEVWRGGEAHSLNATLGDGQTDEAPIMGSRSESRLPVGLGLEVDELTASARRQLEVARDLEGVVITRVVSGGPAAAKGLRRGDVITMVGQTAVATPEEFEAAVEAAAEDGREAILLQVSRGGVRQFVALSLG